MRWAATGLHNADPVSARSLNAGGVGAHEDRVVHPRFFVKEFEVERPCPAPPSRLKRLF